MEYKNKLKTAFSALEMTLVIAVIGIIVALTIGGSSMLRQARYNKAQHFTKTAPVMEIFDKKGDPAITAWYEATNLDNFTFSSSSSFAIDTWYDISGNNHDLSSYSSSQRPVWQEALLNDLPAIKFERSDQDQMSYAGNLLSYAGTQATIIAVIILESNVESTLFSQNNGSGDNPITLHIDSDLTTQIYTNTTTEVSKTLLVDTPYILIGRVNVGDNVESCLLTQNTRDCDNTAEESEFHLGGASFTVSDTTLSLSADMYLAELIIFKKALVGEELAKVKKYLGNKYNIPVDNSMSFNY